MDRELKVIVLQRAQSGGYFVHLSGVEPALKMTPSELRHYALKDQVTQHPRKAPSDKIYQLAFAIFSSIFENG